MPTLDMVAEIFAPDESGFAHAAKHDMAWAAIDHVDRLCPVVLLKLIVRERSGKLGQSGRFPIQNGRDEADLGSRGIPVRSMGVLGGWGDW